jgi:hypothetical protein
MGKHAAGAAPEQRNPVEQSAVVVHDFRQAPAAHASVAAQSVLVEHRFAAG